MKQEEHPNITYLKSQNIGPILAQGIAEVYLKHPKFPVEYFAKWLLNYSKSQEIQKIVVDQEIEKQKLIEKYQEVINQEVQKHELEVKELYKDKQVDLDFYQLLNETEYHNELLTSELPEFIQQRKQFTGCYIAVLDFPEKEIAQDDDEEDAHLDKNQPKVLKYIGWSKGQEFLKGEVLGMEEGVTGQVFEPKKDEEVQDGEEVQENENKPDYVYIENVVKEPRMKYFIIPRLGSYMAVGLSFQSYLSAIDSFENGVVANQKFLMEKEEQLKRRSERETEIQDMLREREEAGVEQEEIKQIQDQFEAEKQQDPLWIDIVEPEYPSIKKDYVVCVDTLGQDREIPENEREYIDKLVKLLGRKWEECERRLLHHDVELQASYLEGITANFEQIIENFVTEEENFIMERQQQLDEFKDKEFELLYETECLRLEKIQQQLQDPEISRYIYMVKDFRMMKYPQLFQIILYLLGYKREDINYPGTNNLNWKYVRTMILDDEKFESEEEKFIGRVCAYEHRGAKDIPVPNYAKIMRLTKRKEKLQQVEIDAYNIGLGRLFHWLDVVLKLRRMNIELRQIQKQRYRQEQQDKIQENEQLVQLKAQELENYKNGLTEEELEAFDEEEWERQFDEQNPMQEVPPEIEDDIDLDQEEIQQQEEQQQQQQQQ